MSTVTIGSIQQRVAALPEKYQPIFGHPELSDSPSRACGDRLLEIMKIHDALQRKLGRSLTVLDLGCAQGYFSLSLAEAGADVLGIDFLPANLEVCRALAAEHSALKVSFEASRIEKAIEYLQPGRFDLVLGLSVFHHIAHEKGADEVKRMINLLAERAGCLILEVALKEEPLYWGPAQPDDPRSLLEDIAFVFELGRHGTHLAPIARPLFVASNQYWILQGQSGRFDSWTIDPHVLAENTHQDSRRYIFGENFILKLFRFDHSRGDHNKKEFTNEISLLWQPPTGFPAPALIAFEDGEVNAGIVMQRIKGRLLLDLLREGALVDMRSVLLAVLEQLAVLESAGLYHNDVRTWNVLVAEDGTTHLIDYGSISPKPQDCVWPGNLFLAFLIFVREVVTGVVDDPNPMRTISISPFGLPQPYRSWATTLWRHPLNEWSFLLMHKTLQETPAEMIEEPVMDANSAWMKAIEEAIQTQKLFVQHVVQQAEAKAEQAEVKAVQAEEKAQQAEEKAQQAEAKARQAEEKARQAEAKAEQAEAKAEQAEAKAEQAEEKAQQAEEKAQQAEAKAEQAEEKAQQAEEKAQQAEEKAQQAEEKAQQAEAASNQHLTQLRAVYASTSWRITAPLRWVGRIARWFVQGSVAWLTFAPQSRPRRVARQVYHIAKDPVGHGIRFVVRRPHFKKCLRSWVASFPALERWLIEERSAQLREDFAKSWPGMETISVGPQPPDANFTFQANAHAGQRSVDEILDRIRAELRKATG